MAKAVKTITPEEVDEKIITNEIAKYSIQDQDIEAMREKYLNLTIQSINDRHGLNEVHEARMLVKKNRIAIQNTTKAIKKRIKHINDRIMQHSDYLVSRLEPIEEHLQLQENWVEEEKARIKEQKEQERRELILRRIEQMTEVGMISTGISYSYPPFSIQIEGLEDWEEDKFINFLATVAEHRMRDLERQAEEERLRLEEEARQAELKRQEEERLEQERIRLKKLADEQAERDRLFKEQQEQFEREKREFEEKKRAEERAKVEEEERKRAIAEQDQIREDLDKQYEKERLEDYEEAAKNPVTLPKAEVHDAYGDIKLVPDKKGFPGNMPNPTEKDLQSPLFEAIWQSIKTWDLNVPKYYDGYMGANGSHVMMIIQGMREHFAANGLEAKISKKK